MTQSLPPPELLPPESPPSAAPDHGGVAPGAVPVDTGGSGAIPVLPPRMFNGARLGALLLAVLLGLMAALWWKTQSDIQRLRIELAQRLVAGDTLNSDTRGIVKAAQDGIRDTQSRIAVIEGKQVDTQAQQLALEQLYQDLSKNRDDWALAEIEQVLSTASQQLQLAGNVRGALIALQNADARLSMSDKPQFIAIRRTLARDMDRLKALPTVDLTGLALRLDSIIGQIDTMPLLADEKPAQPASEPRLSRTVARPAATAATAGAPEAAAVPAGAAPVFFAGLQDRWQSLTSEVWDELRQLIRVRTVGTPEALLLSPTQAYYARENLKLRLLNARLALLSRNESAFRSDMIAAQDTIGRYFDTRARQTQSAQALLRQVQGSDLSIEMPTLGESLAAVRNYKAKP